MGLLYDSITSAYIGLKCTFCPRSFFQFLHKDSLYQYRQHCLDIRYVWSNLTAHVLVGLRWSPRNRCAYLKRYQEFVLFTAFVFMKMSLCRSLSLSLSLFLSLSVYLCLSLWLSLSVSLSVSLSSFLSLFLCLSLCFLSLSFWYCKMINTRTYGIYGL